MWDKTRRTKLDAATRAKALEAGLWQKSNGEFIAVRKMPDGHLLNALLKAFDLQEPDTITKPLTEEVVRRNLQAEATALAAERQKERPPVTHLASDDSYYAACGSVLPKKGGTSPNPTCQTCQDFKRQRDAEDRATAKALGVHLLEDKP